MCWLDDVAVVPVDDVERPDNDSERLIDGVDKSINPSLVVSRSTAIGEDVQHKDGP